MLALPAVYGIHTAFTAIIIILCFFGYVNAFYKICYLLLISNGLKVKYLLILTIHGLRLSKVIFLL